jgi:hypothetical protein
MVIGVIAPNVSAGVARRGLAVWKIGRAVEALYDDPTFVLW